MRPPLKVHIEGTYALDERYHDSYSHGREMFDAVSRPRYGLYDGGGFLRYLTSPDRQEEGAGGRSPGVPFGADGRDVLKADVDAMAERARGGGSAVCYGHVKLYAPYDEGMSEGKWRRLVRAVFPTYLSTLGMATSNVDALFVAHTAEGHPPHLHFVFWERTPDRVGCRGHDLTYTPFSEIKRSAGTLSSLTERYLSGERRGLGRETAVDAARLIRKAGERRDPSRKDIALEMLSLAGDMYRDCVRSGWTPPKRRRGKEEGKTAVEPGFEVSAAVEEEANSLPEAHKALPSPGVLRRPEIPFPSHAQGSPSLPAATVLAVTGGKAVEAPMFLRRPVAPLLREGSETVTDGHEEPVAPYVRICDAVGLDPDAYRPKAGRIAEDMSRHDPSVREADAHVRVVRVFAEKKVLEMGCGDVGEVDRPEAEYVRAREDLVLGYVALLADTITPYGDELATGAHRGRARRIKLDYRKKYEDAFFREFHERVPKAAEKAVKETEEAVYRSIDLREERERAEAAEERERRRREDERRWAEFERQAGESRRRDEERRAEEKRRRDRDRGGMSR